MISTLLLSFIGVWMLYWCVQSTNLLRQPMTNTATLPESLEIPDATKLPRCSPATLTSPLHVGLSSRSLLAVAIGRRAEQRRVRACELRAVGLNELAARRAGMPDRVVDRAARWPSPARFGGLAGAIMLQGDQYC